MRLVIVDDDAQVLSFLAAALETGPECVVTACHLGAEGIAACLEPTDLAIFDNQLPDMTGVEAVARLRAHPVTRHLPIIVITGDTDRQTRLAAIRAGATDFLHKPVSLEELRLRVSNLLALHRAQKRAAERQTLLETLIAASGAHIAVADARVPETPVLFVSDSLLALTALTAADVLGRRPETLWECAPDGTCPKALESAVAARSGGRFLIGCAAPGKPAWLEVTLTPVPGPGSAAQYLVIAQQDITDMIGIREAHDRLAGRLSDIARVTGAWFFEVDANRRLTYVSDTLARALGTTPNLATGLSLDQVAVMADDGARLFAADSVVFTPPYRPVENETATFKLPDGTTRAVQINAVPFHDASGAFAGFRGHASDVSQITRARDEAARANRAKTAFLTTMSHEMRTPLTAIIGLADLMAQSPLPSAQKEHLAEISCAAAGLAEVLSDVLDLAAMEQGKLTLSVAPFDPERVLAQAVTRHRPAAQARGLLFDWRVQGGNGALRRGDAERLRQIIQALVSNAVKFTEKGGVSVLLDCRATAEMQLTVADTGIGMGPEEQAKAFTPFTQADDGIDRRFDGAGLGLSIAHRLTEAMGGHLALTSTPGEGTVLQVSLPLPQVPQPPAPGADVTGWRVLVADDTQSNRKILQAMLGRMGAEVILCQDGAEALDQWQHGHFDALLLDINMPRMAGTDVIRAIRRQEALQGLPPVLAIAVTANAQPHQVAQYRQAGFDGCVAKPFTSAVLTAAMRQQVGTPA